MEKKFKSYFLIMLILLICATGCDKEDYEKYKKSIGNGVSCSYAPDGTANKLNSLVRFTINATAQDVSINYITDSGSKDYKYIVFKFNGNNEISGIDFNKFHDLGGYTLNYANFKYTDFFESYQNSGSCPDIYFPVSASTTQFEVSTKSIGTKYYHYMSSSSSRRNGSSNTQNSATSTSSSSTSSSSTSSSKNSNGDKLTCDFVAYNPKNVEFGTVTILIDKDYKIKANGRDNLSTYNFSVHSGMTSNSFLNANGDLDCSSVGILPMSRQNNQEFTICFTANQCKSGETGWTLSFNNSSNNSNNTTSNQDNSSNVNDGGGGTTSSSGVCNPSAGLGPSLIFVGHIIRIAKILIPLVIIVFGIMDFFRAVTAGKDDEIKKSTKSFVWRLVAGVVIFFLPAFISFVFSWIENWNNYEGAYEECFKCIWDVGKCIK